MKCSSIFFVEILSFAFLLVISECYAYLPFDHNLVNSHPKPGLKPSFSIHMSVSFGFFLLDVVSCTTRIL